MKTQTNTFKVIIRKDAVKSDKTAALALRVVVAGERKFLPLHAHVQPEHFFEETQRVKVHGEKELTEKVNTIITLARNKAQQILLDAVIKNRSLKMSDFLDQYGGFENKANFLDFFEGWIVKQQGSKAAATLKAYRVTLKNVRSFKSTLLFRDLTPEWVQDFDRYLKKKKFEVNYISKTHGLLKAAINQAIFEKKMYQNPYAGFKMAHAKTERSFLDMKELQRLIDLYRAGSLMPTEQEILRYFLFSCVAGGIRISDVKNLRWDDIEGDLLVFRPEKTQTSRVNLKIPLSDLAKELVFGRKRMGERIFRCYADAVTNRSLKPIAKAAGISQNLTFHAARHTFATVYLAMGGKVHILQQIMGHGKIETTMAYVHIAHDQKVAEMKNFDLVFSPKLVVE